MNEATIWRFLKSQGITDAGAAGLMGNLFAESGLNPKNLQNTYETTLGYTDETYTAAVDSGKYTNFIYDRAGYGLAQWTHWSRKQALLAFCKAVSSSIGDINAQLRFLIKELSESFQGILVTLMSATSVHEASDAVLLQFERPAGKDNLAVQARRTEYAQKYYDMFASDKKGEMVTMSNSPLVTHTNFSPNHSGPRNHTIDTVTIHCFVGQVNAKRGCEVFKPSSKGASCNYVVGYDGSIGLCVEEKNRSWCSGGKHSVNGISGSQNDYRAITIEVASDTKHPYAVTDKAMEALISLLTDICRRNPEIGRLRWKGDKSLVGQVDKQNMTVHRWFADKSCPGDYLYNLHGQIADEVNRRLDNNKEDDNMDIARFKELWIEMRKELQDNDSGAWSQEAREWAASTGLIAGNGTEINGEPNYMWADILTREQFVTVLYRFAKMMGKV